jgi:hypothetical protein
LSYIGTSEGTVPAVTYDPSWIPPRPDRPHEWQASTPALPVPPGSAHRPSRRAPKLVAIVAILAVVAASVVGSLAGPVRTPTPQEQAGPRYTFLETVAGKPVRWNPCEPIHYVVNDTLATYDGALADVEEAADRVSKATGIEFVYDGATDEVPSVHRLVYQPDRYGREWAPVLIGWVDPDSSDISFSRNDDVALGVASPMFPGGGQYDVYVSGWVALNADYHGPGGFDVPSAVGLTAQHELGHIVGMGHTKVFGELMQGAGGGVTDWGPGDLQGLEQLGRDQGCLTEPALPRR